MRRAIILFWHGLTGILTGIANWITVVWKTPAPYCRHLLHPIRNFMHCCCDL